MNQFRDKLEHHQIIIYFVAVVFGAILAFLFPTTSELDSTINAALGFMLLVTFLQVPLVALRQILKQGKFLLALLVTNFIGVPLLVAGLSLFFPENALIQLGMLFVLLTPCIDYVVTFSSLGRADSRLLLAMTPVLLLTQMALLPIYLRWFLGTEAAAFIHPEPFIHAFVWLIVLPLILAACLQFWAGRSHAGQRLVGGFSLLPVPATALVLFIVVVAVVPQLSSAFSAALRALPIYLAFAVLAPLLGWGVGRLFRLEAMSGRALAFSSATRNSLVVLPLALAVPGALPVLPAVIVMQTLVELISQLFYIRWIARWGGQPQEDPPLADD